VKKVSPEIISCDICSGKTYFTGKLYYISSTDVTGDFALITSSLSISSFDISK
jgi:hypothetical protein